MHHGHHSKPGFFMRRRYSDNDYYDRGYDDYQDDYYDDYYDDRDRYNDRDGRRDYSREREQQQYQEPPPKRKKGGAAGAIGFMLFRLLIIVVLMLLLLPQVYPDPFPENIRAASDKFVEYLMAGMYKYQEIPDTVEFTVERDFTIESNGQLDFSLFMPIPKNLEIDGQKAQDLLDSQFSPQYTRIYSEDNKWVWEGSMPNGGSYDISIIYKFKTAKIKWDISIRKSGTIDDVPRSYKNKFLGDQWPVKNYQDQENIDTDNDGVPDTEDVDDDNDGRIDKYRMEPSNPEIRQLLLQILADADLYSGSNLNELGHLNVYKVVKAIYDHIDDTCLYPTQEEQYYDSQRYGSYPKWSTGTYDDRRGDCDDQSILFISLCRAAGIPAMLEIGALYDPNFDHWEGHGWANVIIPYNDDYAEEKGENSISPMVDIVNNIFLFRDPNRFSEWVDNGNRGEINAETGEWEYSDLEKRYLAWEYTRGSSAVSVDINEEYVTLDFTAHPPEKKLYL
jgi:hypothetical protein